MRWAIRTLASLLAAAVCALPADSGLLRLAPPDAAVVIGIRLDQIKTSPLGQLIFSQIAAPAEDLKKFVEVAGFDPLRDVNQLLLAAPAITDQQRGLMLLRGTFDPGRLPALAKMANGELDTYQGIQIATTKQQKQAISMACTDPSTLIIGDPQSVRGAIGRLKARGGLTTKLLTRAAELSQAYDIWGISTIPPGLLAKGVPSPQLSGALKGEALQSIREASGGIRIGKDIQMAVEVVTRSEKDATALGDVLRFLLGLAVTQGKPEQTKLLESLQVKIEGSTLKFGITVPEQQVAQMIEAQKKALAAQRRRAEAKPTPAQTGVTIYSSPKDMGVVKLPGPK